MRILSIIKFLYVQRIKGFDPPSDVPWMDACGTARFLEELKRATLYLEYGSGGTTVIADRLGIPTLSVESDPFYARAVKSRLSKDGCITQIVVNVGMTSRWGTPIINSPAKAHSYVQAPYAGPEFPDFILVDGRYRSACALAAGRRAFELQRRATLMVDDYVDRAYNHKIEPHLGKPEIVGRSAIFIIGSKEISESSVMDCYAETR